MPNRTSAPRGRRAAAVVLALGALAPAAAASPSTATPPQAARGRPEPGAPGLGDRLYPRLGNGGYDVRAYDVSLDYRRRDRPLAAVTRIDAVATQDLSRFDLDFAHGTVRAVRVDGRPAAFRTAKGELVVTPARPVPLGRTMRVEVTHTSDPSGGRRHGGWITTPDGLAMAGQPADTHRVFPCNDHPSDKAAFTFHVTAPKALTVVASGLPRGTVPAGHGRTTWTYRLDHPMAPEVAQIAIGDAAVVRRTGPHGLPLRDVVPRHDTAAVAPLLAGTPRQITWMERRLGRFPFATYGILGVEAGTGFELETQTLSLFERRVLLAPEALAAPLMVHELAHQWFGDSVTPATWSDLWLNEGHATWYQWTYAAHHYGVDLERRARSAYASDQEARRAGGPPAAPRPPGASNRLGIFRANVYNGGALALYALRRRIGAPAFARLERLWVRRYRDATATTADFTALASEVSGRDQRAFLHRWLHGRTTPPMPGHPDWTTDRPAVPRAHHAPRPSAHERTKTP
jgi:aminopeptidase N